MFPRTGAQLNRAAPLPRRVRTADFGFMGASIFASVGPFICRFIPLSATAVCAMLRAAACTINMYLLTTSRSNQ
jgi:hypothetical protein